MSIFFLKSLFEYHTLFSFQENEGLDYLIENANNEADLLASNSYNFFSHELKKIIGNPYNITPLISSLANNFISNKFGEIDLSLIITTNMINIIFILLFFGLLLFYRSSMNDLKEEKNFKKLIHFLVNSGFPSHKVFDEVNYLLTIFVSGSFFINGLFFIIVDQLHFLPVNSTNLLTIFQVNLIASFVYYCFDLYSFLIIGIPNLLLSIIILIKFPKIVLYVQFLIQKVLIKSKNLFKRFSFFMLSVLRSPNVKNVLSIELIIFCSFLFVPLYFIQFQQNILQTEDNLETGADLNLKIAFHDSNSLNTSNYDIFQYFQNFDIVITPYFLFDVYLSSRNIYYVTTLALDFSAFQYIAKQGFKIYSPTGLEPYQKNFLFFSIQRYEEIINEFPNSEAYVNFGTNTLSDNLNLTKCEINGFFINFPMLENSFSSSLSSMVMNIDLYLDLVDNNNIDSATLETGYLIWFKENLSSNNYKIIHDQLNSQGITHSFSKDITGVLNNQRQVFLDNLSFLALVLTSIFFILFLLIFILKLHLFSNSIKEINLGLFSQNVNINQLFIYNLTLMTIINVSLLVGSNIFGFGFNYAWQTIFKLFIASINDRMWQYRLDLINNFNLLFNFCLLIILTLFSGLKIRHQVKNLKLDVT